LRLEARKMLSITSLFQEGIILFMVVV